MRAHNASSKKLIKSRSPITSCSGSSSPLTNLVEGSKLMNYGVTFFPQKNACYLLPLAPGKMMATMSDYLSISELKKT